MRLLEVLICSVIACVTVVRVCEASQCICAHSGSYWLHGCPSDYTPPIGQLYQDGEGNNCLLAAPQVVTNIGWKAGIRIDASGGKSPEQDLVYFRADGLITEEPCSMTILQIDIKYNKGCTKLKPGMFLNAPVTKPPTKATPKLPVLTKSPTTPTPTNKLPVLTKSPTTPTPTNKLPVLTKSPTTPTPTNKLPVLTKSPTNPTPTNKLPVLTRAPTKVTQLQYSATSAPTKVTQSANQTTSGPVFVTVPTQRPSIKCDWQKMFNMVFNRIPALHPAARFCILGNGLKGNSEALLLSSCSRNHDPNFLRWQSELKVMDHCNSIPKGEPLAVFVGNGAFTTGKFAAFWKCTGNSFQVVHQSCLTGFPRIDDVTRILNVHPEMVYTIKW